MLTRSRATGIQFEQFAVLWLSLLYSFQGEEIGMVDQWISWNDTVDPAACNSNPSIYERFSRDPERTPFQWSDELNAGFSNADRTWLPVASNYKTVNVRMERAADLSHLQVYMSLQRLRRDEVFQQGDLTYAALSQQVVAILRWDWIPYEIAPIPTC